jgi:aminoglycoside phosphotransferase (APT) family kinase protein
LPPTIGFPARRSPAILLRLPLADQQAIAEQLGTFLHQLHTVPLAEAEAHGIGPSVTNRSPERWQKLYDDVRDKLFPYLMQFARDWVEQHFAPVLQDPAFMACEHTFMNGDLGCYHLLYNRDTRRLNGIIDFGTAGLGDPAADFGCLIDQYGETFCGRWLRFTLASSSTSSERAFGQARWSCNGCWAACARPTSPTGLWCISAVPATCSPSAAAGNKRRFFDA